jgi:hypothetical protein
MEAPKNIIIILLLFRRHEKCVPLAPSRLLPLENRISRKFWETGDKYHYSISSSFLQENWFSGDSP